MLIDSIPIIQLDLPIRLKDSLINAGFNTFNDLRCVSSVELSWYPNLGVKSIALIHAEIAKILDPKIDKNSGKEQDKTLRDYFAAKALQGLLANPKMQDEIIKHGGASSGWIESSAYEFADAMLSKRSE